MEHPAALTEKEIWTAYDNGPEVSTMGRLAKFYEQGVANAQLRKALWWTVEEIRNYQQTCEQGNPGYLQAGVIATMVLEDAFKKAGIEPWLTPSPPES